MKYLSSRCRKVSEHPVSKAKNRIDCAVLSFTNAAKPLTLWAVCRFSATKDVVSRSTAGQYVFQKTRFSAQNPRVLQIASIPLRIRYRACTFKLLNSVSFSIDFRARYRSKENQPVQRQNAAIQHSVTAQTDCFFRNYLRLLCSFLDTL